MHTEMRVLYLTMNANLASTTRPTVGWIAHLRPNGLQPVLATPHAAEFYQWAQAQGIPAYQIPLPFPSRAWPWPFLWSLIRLRRLVQRHGIQLIHCNEQNIYPIGQYLARWCRLPVVVSVHFSMTSEYCRWAFGGRRQPQRVFFVSGSNREACRAAMSGVVDENAWRVLDNGLDLMHYRPDSQERAQFRRALGVKDELLIGTACILRPRKQLEHLVAVAAALPQPGLRLVIAGDSLPGEEAYGRQFLAEARERLGDRFIYLGYRAELRGLYNALDLYVNASREEAASISILESMACGCPVVGYASTSVDEQVLPQGGEIVPQDDVAALTSTVCRWLDDPARRAAGRVGARRRAEEKYDIRQAAARLWGEYQELLDTPKK